MGKSRTLQCSIGGQMVGVVVPVRDRAEHLAIWLAHTLPVLVRRQTSFRVFVLQVGLTCPTDKTILHCRRPTPADPSTRRSYSTPAFWRPARHLSNIVTHA